MECAKIQNKLKLLFEKLAEPNYVMDNYYVDGLINKLSNFSDPETECIEKVPLMSDLIIEALQHTERAHNTVKVFLTRVLAIAAQKELHFAKIFMKQGDKILAGFKEICKPNVNPSIKVAHMEVALAIVNHSSGVSWLLETGVWKEILKLCNEKATVFIARQTYKFMADFIWKLNDLADVASVRLLLDNFTDPISKVDFLNVQSLTSEQEEIICKEIDPSLQILYSIVSTENRIQNKTLLMTVLTKEYRLTSHLYIACDFIRSEEPALLMIKLIFWLNLGKVFLVKPLVQGVQFTGEEFLEAAASNFNTVQYLIQRRSVSLVIDYCCACNIILNTICKDYEPQMWLPGANTKIQMRNQLLFISLVPILVFVMYGKLQSEVSDIRISDYISRLLNASCEYTAKAAYALRDLTCELDTLSVILQSVKKIIHLKEHLNDEQANLVFQALFYVLQEYNPVDIYGDLKLQESFEDSEQKDLVMMYVMDSVLSLVSQRNINWHESLEIICLYNVVCNILKRPNLSCKFVVKSLNVITLTVKKFLQPNLSLLMDSKPGSAIHDLGNLIYMKMHDMHWEIRDTALELLHVCTEISFIKFPPFQKQILEHNLINVAATIAFNDYESYVQVSALKCIGAASRISVLWDKLVAEYPDIQDRLLYILRYNEEGIVRKEACNLLCDLYQNIKLTPAFKQTLYEHMVSSALTDFHWEVQVSALKFWKIVYQSFLTNQGMLDGQFPPVTFSKETRKIVTLNETEIQKRLLKILDELAAVGCLTVFVKLLHDDTEVQIMDVTLSTAQELYDILVQYKVHECARPKSGELRSVEELTCHIKEEPEDADDNEEMPDAQSPEHVIEDILNADDVNLLANIYERHMTIQGNKGEAPLKPKIKLLKFASPYLFISYLKNTDFKAVIEEKRKWNDGIRSMSSLLDDMLGLYEVNDEVNSLDCY
ncbi:integrator complex assembly factor Brat1-like [Anticarsia gemmatalis]|uniref:integrator complex assembly factor Brat1-like n=1 Tax=Anticarsia gemmatalis TaxID=129554 RepID=UPI003F76F6C7